ncbi:MAG: hypothetical protein RR640_00735 [Oscillospiraceae bacterium]
MNSFFRRKLITPFLALLLVLGSVGGTIGVMQLIPPSQIILSTEQLYKKSVEDAMIADADEIKPLVTLTKESNMVTWNEKADKILLISWHKYPDRYKQGETTTLSHGEVWTFTDKEIAKWYQANKNGVSDWNLRFKQLIGLPPDSKYTHFTALWANPADVYRPAYITDIATANMATTLIEKENTEYKNWFNDNILFSYYEDAYPWTRLGYTYDWADNGTEYGLSEFLIAKDAAVSIEFTKTTEDFIKWLDGINK